jgi:predicted N-acetyltransferase YhbS
MEVPQPLKFEQLPDSQVSPQDDQGLRDLLSVCFLGPDDHVFKTRRYFQEAPQHRIVLRDEAGVIRAQVAAHDKIIGTTEGDLRIAGLAEVAVHPDLRGRGIANLLLAEFHSWAVNQDFPFAMLFGNPKIYGSKGYVVCENLIRSFDWKTQKFIESYSKPMQKPLSTRAWPAGLIDIRCPNF